ncbi:MAG: ABC transporter permease [Solirubrobacterales bacterium]|nr:ABC transporter permease [Solirubrobacterales bacterium]
MKARLTPYLLNLPAMGWMIIFFLVPLVSIMSISLMTGDPIKGYDLTWNFGIFSDVFSQYSAQIGRSFLYGAISTALALVAMYPVAYWIAFHGGRRKAFFLFLLLLPFLVSFIIRILVWQFILSDDGMVLSLLKQIGIIGENAHILSTPTAVVIGLTYDALPWMALPIFVALEKIDRDQIEAAGDLYASGFEQFRRVILPLSAPGMYAGILLVGITNVGDFLSAMLLGGPSTTMVGNIIQTQYVQNGNFPIASALSLILMVLLLVCVFVYARIFGVRTLQEYA